MLLDVFCFAPFYECIFKALQCLLYLLRYVLDSEGQALLSSEQINLSNLPPPMAMVGQLQISSLGTGPEGAQWVFEKKGDYNKTGTNRG